MSNSRICIGASAVVSLVLGVGALMAQETATKAESGEAGFNSRCKRFHEPAMVRAPPRAEVAFRSPASIIIVARRATNDPALPSCPSKPEPRLGTPGDPMKLPAVFNQTPESKLPTCLA